MNIRPYAQLLNFTPKKADKTPVKQDERIRVLIADDDHLLSRRLCDYIIERGFDARVVSNGKDARTEIMTFKPRFILGDLMLPDGGALTLIDFIRGEKSLRHQFMHVIVMSGHNVEANVRQALQRGAKDYLVKPFRYEDTLRRLVFHCRGYRHRGGPLVQRRLGTRARDPRVAHRGPKGSGSLEFAVR